MQEGARLRSLGACLRMEYGLTQKFMEKNDFFEGVRALLVDKDQNPKWKPAALGEVTAAEINSYFAPLKTALPLALDFQDDFRFHKM